MKSKILLLFLAASVSCYGKNVVDVHEVAVTVSEQGLSKTNLGHYMGVNLYHSMAELALASGESADMERVMDILLKIRDGEIKMTYHTFIDYEIGGQAPALLAYAGKTEFDKEVRECAAKMWAEQPRTSTGIMTTAHYVPTDGYWIDIVSTVSPFFLYTGLLEGNSEYVDYAAYYVLRAAGDLYDNETGLYHQGYNHDNCPGVSADNWSRGNGWMAVAMCTLLHSYPRDGKYWPQIEQECRRFFEAVCRWQDENGMWHQEMSDHSSYVETSGSAQVLAGVGAAIEAGVLDRKKYLPYFEKGLKGLLGYVDPDGSVGQCCKGNCVPGTGRKEDFTPIHWYFNESHCSGPVVLAAAQALRLGIKTVRLDSPLGSSNDTYRPRAYARLITERKNDVAWENDRVAFRVYSKVVDNKAASGVDFWGKSVDYSIIDEWYSKGDKGKGLSYHRDSGTGCDFYNMGNGRGIGGTGIWGGDTLVCPEVYDTVTFASQGPERLSLTLGYTPYEAFGRTFTETKKIEMVCGTSFYKVSHTITSSDGGDILLGVGLTTFGAPEIIKEQDGQLFISEKLQHKERIGIGTDGSKPKFESQIGSAVVVNPALAAGTVKCGSDCIQLLNVRSGETITYYVGATWSFQVNSGRWKGDLGFWRMTASEATWAGLEELYK